MAKNRLSRPYVVAKSAQTLDGKVATSKGLSKWITSKETRDFARKKRDQFQGIMVGRNTALKDNPRLSGVKRKNLKKIIVDSSLKITNSVSVIKTGKNCIIGTTPYASKRKIKKFEQQGIQVVVCPSKNKQVDLKYFFDRLYQAGIKKLLIEGGPTLIGQALDCNLVDQVHVYIAPKIMADQNALSSVIGINSNKIENLHNLRNLKIKRLNKDILVVADVYRNR